MPRGALLAALRAPARLCYASGVLPPAFIERLERIVPADRLPTVLASFSLDKPASLWLNPLRAPPDDTLAALRAAFPEAHFAPLFANAVTTTLDASVLAHSPIITDGRAYIINPSSLIPPAVLAPEPGDEVLDLCAAPGGKTLQLASYNPTYLAAVEAVKPRFFKLQGILDRYGVLARPGNTRLFLKDGRDVGGAVPERFDKVLLDAPCSSEARFDADDEATSRHWSAHKIAECAYKQRGLLRSALTALKVGGTMVYCTCSFAPEENEAVVSDTLRELDGAVVTLPTPLPVPLTGPIPAMAGIDLPDAWRILPDAMWDGFFLVRLQKMRSTSDTSTTHEKSSRRHEPPARRRHRPR